MAMTVNSILAQMASDFGVPSLGSNSRPTLTQALSYLNTALLDLVRVLCPSRIAGGDYSVGRLDKLTRLTETEIKSETAPVSTDPNLLALPSSNTPLHYVSIAVSTAGGSAYRAREWSYGQIYERRANQSYAATAAKPLFAWGNGGIFVVPAGNGSAQAATYHFIEKHTALAVGADWVLDEDLINPTLELALALAWGQREGDLAEMQITKHVQRYLQLISFYLGSFASLSEDKQ